MRILVCVKQVPDTAEVKIDPVTNNLVRAGVPSMINPADRTALTAALRLRAVCGGTVTVISMGPPQAAAELERCLRWGADEAYLLCDRKLGGADTLATGHALAGLIARLGYDLVLCGNEAVDGCTGQVGPGIGETLGIPAFSYVSELRSEDGASIDVTRSTGDTQDTYRVKLPALACLLRQETAELPEREDIPAVQMLDASFLDETQIGSKGSPTRVVKITVKQREYQYLQVDYHWPLEQRMDYIFRGGLSKKDVNLLRGTAAEQAQRVLVALERQEVQQR